jgi:hypothetical protein
LLDFIEEKGKEVALTLSVLRKWQRWRSLIALWKIFNKPRVFKLSNR